VSSPRESVRRGRGRPSKLKPTEEFEMRQYREVGMSIAQCALWFKVSRATVLRTLAELRTKLGPETLKRKHLARSHCDTSPKSRPTG
jgi:predicted DNA-binding protein (UPF0251 family)